MLDKKSVELIFKMLPLSKLRKIANKKDLIIKSNSKNEFVNKLLENEWTDEELKTYIKHLKTIIDEKKPISNYIARIDSIDIEFMKNKLEENSAKIGEKEGRPVLLSDGFEIIEYEENKKLLAKHWKKDYNRYLGPFGRLIEQEMIKNIDFIIDLEQELLFFKDTSFQQARGLIKILRFYGLEITNVGLQGLVRKDANKKFQEFVNKFEQKLNILNKGRENGEN